MRSSMEKSLRLRTSESRGLCERHVEQRNGKPTWFQAAPTVDPPLRIISGSNPVTRGHPKLLWSPANGIDKLLPGFKLPVHKALDAHIQHSSSHRKESIVVALASCLQNRTLQMTLYIRMFVNKRFITCIRGAGATGLELLHLLRELPRPNFQEHTSKAHRVVIDVHEGLIPKGNAIGRVHLSSKSSRV